MENRHKMRGEKGGFMFDEWIREIRKNCDPESLGMILLHNGIVRGTSKAGELVTGMALSYDKELLESTVAGLRTREGIADIRVWINEGELLVGDDIMCLLVAGRFRTDVLPVLQELLTIIKTNVVREEEMHR
jgi:molybdopterin synthase catalytic subunit